MVTIGAAVANATLDKPVDHLAACHRRIEEKLVVLQKAADANDTGALERTFRFFETNGAWHTSDEEVSIFPRLAGRLDEGEAGLIRELEAEHGRIEQIYERVRAGELDAIPEMVERYRKHIAREDTELAPLLRAKLSADDLTAIASEMRARRERGGL